MEFDNNNKNQINNNMFNNKIILYKLKIKLMF